MFCIILVNPALNNSQIRNDDFSDDLVPQALGLYKKWQYASGPYVLNAPASADINMDGDLETVYSEYNELFCLNSTGDLIWSNTVNFIETSPTISDLNHDGYSEILIADGDTLLCFNYSGIQEWSFEADRTIPTSPSLADLNNDSDLEIILCGVDYLYCLYANGSLNWFYYFLAAGIAEDAPPAICDLDADGMLDIICCAHDDVYCFNSTGFVKWTYSLERSLSPSIADLDQDGNLDIIVNSLPNDLIVCLDQNGLHKWNYSVSESLHSSPVVADLDADGTLEVVFNVFDNVVYCLNHIGTIEWTFVEEIGPSDEVLFYSDPAVSDINNDGFLEVIVCSTQYIDPFHYGIIYCLDYNGNKICFYEEESFDFWESSPILIDLEKDGILEILVGYDYGLVCFGFSGISSSGSQQWYCYRGSIFHTGHFDSDSDYLDDLTEDYYETNPFDPDTDKDKLSDSTELFTYATNPLLYDTDFDGFSDFLEISEGTDPLDPFDHPPTTVTPPPITVTPPPVTVTPPPETITLPPGTITQNNTVTTTVEAGIIMITSVVSVVTVLTIVVITIRKKRK